MEKMTEELRRRIKSLESTLEETKKSLKRSATTSGDKATHQNKKAKNAEGDGKKSNKTPGDAVARSTVNPNKNRKWK
jgi:ribosome recycling factor